MQGCVGKEGSCWLGDETCVLGASGRVSEGIRFCTDGNEVAEYVQRIGCEAMGRYEWMPPGLPVMRGDVGSTESFGGLRRLSFSN